MSLRFLLSYLIFYMLYAFALGTKWRKTYGPYSNVARRVTAIWCVCVGVMAIAAVIVSTARPGMFHTDPTLTIGARLGFVALFAVLVAVGAAEMRTPTYRPDLGDTPRGTGRRASWQQELGRRQYRNWWTGEPLRSVDAGRSPGENV